MAVMATKVLTGLDIAHRIEQKLPGAVEEAVPEFAMIKSDRLTETLTYLRDEDDLNFKFLSSLTAVDRMEWFEVAYHLESFKLNQSTCVKVRTFDREKPVVPSAVTVWQGAHLQEREAYDLMGIYFDGHPDMRRLFLWDGFDGFPLRKDYLGMPGGLMPGLERFPGEPGIELSGRGTE